MKLRFVSNLKQKLLSLSKKKLRIISVILFALSAAAGYFSRVENTVSTHISRIYIPGEAVGEYITYVSYI